MRCVLSSAPRGRRRNAIRRQVGRIASVTDLARSAALAGVHWRSADRVGKKTNGGRSVAVSDIGSDTGGEADVVQREVRDERVQLEQQRQRLADTTCRIDPQGQSRMVYPLRWSIALPARRMRTPRVTSLSPQTGEGRDGPAAPRTATLVAARAEVEKPRVASERRVAANILSVYGCAYREKRESVSDRGQFPEPKAPPVSGSEHRLSPSFSSPTFKS